MDLYSKYKVLQTHWGYTVNLKFSFSIKASMVYPMTDMLLMYFYLSVHSIETTQVPRHSPLSGGHEGEMQLTTRRRQSVLDILNKSFTRCRLTCRIILKFPPLICRFGAVRPRGNRLTRKKNVCSSAPDNNTHSE